jgi:hypothetical protein
MDLIRDVLDKRVVDRNGREMGRVDGIVLEQRPGTAPLVAAIRIGPSVLGNRIHPAIGRWVAALEYGFGIHEGRPVRLPISALEIAADIKTDVAIGETAAGVVEQRLRKWIGKLPGAR